MEVKRLTGTIAGLFELKTLLLKSQPAPAEQLYPLMSKKRQLVTYRGFRHKPTGRALQRGYEGTRG